MASLLNEIEDEIKQERLINQLKRWGPIAAGAVVLLIIAVTGGRWYQDYQDKKDAATTALLQQAIDDVPTAGLVATIQDKGTKDHQALAGFVLAKDLLDKKDYKQALATYDAIAQNTQADRGLRHLAGTLAFYTMLEYGLEDNTVDSRYSSLSAITNPWSFTVRELQAWHSFRNGRLIESKATAEQLVKDQGTPSSIVNRMETLITIIGG